MVDNRIFQRLVAQGTLVSTAFLAVTLSGCCGLEFMANSTSHWGENRCSCEPADTCTPGCPAPCVTLESPEGYLNQGATFSGEKITGPPGKTALQRMTELNDELEELRASNQQLHDQLERANQTIEEQVRAVDSAEKELQRAMTDYSEMRDRLERWYADLDAIDQTYRTSAMQQNRLLDRFEQELEAIIVSCDEPLDDESFGSFHDEPADPRDRLPPPIDTGEPDQTQPARKTLLPAPQPPEQPAGPPAEPALAPVVDGAVTLRPPKNRGHVTGISF